MDSACKCSMLFSRVRSYPLSPKFILITLTAFIVKCFLIVAESVFKDISANSFIFLYFIIS